MTENDRACLWTWERLMDNSVIYGAGWDFEPDNSGPDSTSWMHKDKWFMSCLAVLDIKELLCLN